MALVGQLGDLDLTELFHILSLFQKSGRLTLSADDMKGEFLFKNGKIVDALDGAPKENLGDILMRGQLITETELQIALDQQASEPDHRRLGVILVDMGVVTQTQVENAVRERLQGITEEFLHLDHGFFSFKPLTSAAGAGKTGKERELDLPSGMNTDQFILDLLTRLDEMDFRRGGPGPGPRRSVEGVSAKTITKGSDNLVHMLDYMVDTTMYETASGEAGETVEAAKSLADLRSLMVEIQLRSPSFSGEITLMILRYATQVVNRGLLCHVADHGITGIGQFGLGRESETASSVDRRIRTMCIPLNEPSVFMEVFETMHSYRGHLKTCHWNDQLVRILGGPMPREVVVIPIMVDGMIAGLFYGDNVPLNTAIGPLHALELLMIEAGLAMEKGLLRTRLQQVEDKLELLTKAPEGT